MASQIRKPPPRKLGKALLLTLPILLWALLMFSRAFQQASPAVRAAALLTAAFMVTLFFLMMRTYETNRWRRVFFVALGFLFPIGFIWELIAVRGSMSMPIEEMLAGNAPFCFLAIPMMIVPAALAKTIIFPGSILPTPSNPHAIGVMIGLWLAATIVLGKGWCSFGCFFGGLEEGFSNVLKKARIRNISAKWRLAPWAVLAAIVLLSAATFEPIYCAWLCPFKTVTEYAEVRSLEGAVQTGIFLSLFAGLVVTLPVLTKKRTQCAGCVSCQRSCPIQALDKDSVERGKTLMTCMKCGACVDVCHKQAAFWHIKGTAVGISSERARLLYLYAAWGFATMFGGSILANSLQRLLGFLG